MNARLDVEIREYHAGDESRSRRVLMLVDGVVAGLAGGVALALPLVIWDWAHAGHRALELPMATTAWLFGLGHFSHTQNLWWPIVLGVVILALYTVIAGLAYAGLADRVFALDSRTASLVGGAAWGFVTFVFTWTMLLPIARDGVPFRVSSVDPGLFVAPNWVWILGFTLLGLVTGGVYGELHRSALAMSEDRKTVRDEFRRRFHYAA